VNIVQILYTHTCKWKNILVETIPGIREEGQIKEKRRMMEGVHSSMTYFIYR
jgi:hypothetical protein